MPAGKQFPFIVVSPQCPNGQSWEPFKLTALLDEIGEKYKVDQDRIYLTGLSMGGFGTWALAAIRPIGSPPSCRSVAAAIRPGRSESPTFLPGCSTAAKIQPCRVENSKKMVEALKKNGGNPKLTIYPEAGHDSWTEAYNTPELYEWLLQQKRTTKKADEPKK